MQSIIAVVCDCDGTLAPDTTNFLLEENGVDVDWFWRENDALIRDGWDPPMAWMTRIRGLMDSGAISQHTNAGLAELGGRVEPFAGVPGFIPQMREKLSGGGYADVRLECYIISSGIEDLIRGAGFAREFTDVFGSRFSEDGSGRIDGIKSIVTFTEKTKFLYALTKGITGHELRSNPFRVNDMVPEGSRRIPFKNMIYLGDSTGDVPCIAAVTHFGGDGIGILTESNVARGFKLGKERRTTAGPYRPNYNEGSDLRAALDGKVLQIADRMAAENA